MRLGYKARGIEPARMPINVGLTDNRSLGLRLFRLEEELGIKEKDSSNAILQRLDKIELELEDVRRRLNETEVKVDG